MDTTPQTLEHSILQAVQLLPVGWAVEIMVEKGFVSISCVNPEGEDETFLMDDKNMAEMVESATAQACYVDMVENLEA